MANDVLTFSEVVSLIKGKPGSNGWCSGHCPCLNHKNGDANPSLGVIEHSDGSIGFHSFAGCSYKAIIDALESKTGKKVPKGAAREVLSESLAKPNEIALTGLTVKRYAALKGLPADWLRLMFSIYDLKFRGKPAVAFPYHAEIDGKWGLTGIKVRKAENLHGNSEWLPGDFDKARVMPYGLDFSIPADEYDLLLVEGESDTQTLRAYNYNVLGIAGAKLWKTEFKDLHFISRARRVYIIKEPDRGGDDFIANVGKDIGGKLWVVTLPEGIKDASELHLKYLDEPRRVIADALPEGFDKLPGAEQLRLIIGRHAVVEESRFVRELEAACDAANPFKDVANAPILPARALTDSGNAERLVDMHGQNFRYVRDDEVFAIWDGEVWQRDESGVRLLPHTKEVVRTIQDVKWQQASEAAGKRKAMIALAKGEESIFAESRMFDRHPMLLNVQNGTLDLETQKLRDYQREEFLTKKAMVLYDPFAQCPKFDSFMKFTFGGDKDTIHFMAKASGYTLTGNVGESCFFVCHGLGANGKTTFIELLMQLLGPDFASPAKFSTFIDSKFHDSKYELAAFKDKRLITAVEPRKAGHLDEEVLKQMTGGDAVRARDIYKRDVVYYPEFKLWLAMNNKPQIVGTDDGIWRRVRFVPFNCRVDDSIKIKDYAKVLFREEGPGILNRLLEGVRAWLEEGLKMSPAVARATAEFRNDQNVIQEFFDTYTVSGKNDYHARAGDLHKAYKMWANAQGEFTMRQNEFAGELARRGFEKRIGHGNVTYWWGVGLTDEGLRMSQVVNAG